MLEFYAKLISIKLSVPILSLSLILITLLKDDYDYAIEIRPDDDYRKVAANVSHLW